MINSHITYEVGLARIGDLRSQADERRRARRESDASRRIERRRRPSRQPLRALGTLTLRRA